MTALPTPKMERWKYTNLPAKLKKFDLVEGVADISFNEVVDYVQVFPENIRDLPAWVKEMVARSAPGEEKYQDMMLWQAANDVLKNGFIIDVPKNVDVTGALEVTTRGHNNKQITTRQIIRVAEGASLTMIENQNGEGEYWNNIVIQIELAKGAHLQHYRFQENSEQSIVTQNTHIVIEEGAQYEAFTLTGGSNLSRNQIHVDMNGENGICQLNGINLLDGSKLADTTITIEHHAPHCKSSQNYRTVAGEKAVGTFQGKIHVYKEAQKTNGYQMAKSLLLSQQATINTKPELEIYADDVKCSHGATTGQLDDQALFYMRSRGISESDARHLLIQAFLNEVLEEISNKKVQERASDIVARWLK